MLANPPEYKEACRHSEEVERLMERFYPSAGDAGDQLDPNFERLNINTGNSAESLLDPKKTC